MSIPVLLLSMILFFILFFGIGFLLNMLLRMTWIMVFLYPFVFILLIGKTSIGEYFTNTSNAFVELTKVLSQLGAADIIICLAGFVGALLSGVGIKILRKNGYQMF